MCVFLILQKNIIFKKKNRACNIQGRVAATIFDIFAKYKNYLPFPSTSTPPQSEKWSWGFCDFSPKISTFSHRRKLWLWWPLHINFSSAIFFLFKKTWKRFISLSVKFWIFHISENKLHFCTLRPSHPLKKNNFLGISSKQEP